LREDSGYLAEIEITSPDDFFNRPQHPRARKFLADIRTPFAQPL
ncbi:hypothetical protein K3Z90_27590, partial [Pseudomonas aeruginosa]|nr:hypothetical protein [Pseudomonas aeruginosa]